MKTSLSLTVAAVALVQLTACVNMKQSLAERASFDLGCKVQESNVTEIASGQYGVEACGCHASYVSYPSWTLNAVSGESCRSAGPNATSPAASGSAR